MILCSNSGLFSQNLPHIIPVCVCRYRAKIEKIDGKNAHVVYFDFGNVRIINSTLSWLP